MAFVGSINIGVSADTSPLKSDLGQASASVQSFGQQVGSLGAVVKSAFAVAIGGAATAGLMKLASGAAHTNEALNKIDAVFGDQAEGVKASARAMAEAYGISINDILDKQGQLGSLFSGSGFDASATAQYTKALTSLANDLSRFNEIGFQDAFEKLRAGLTGESEPLKSLGIVFNDEIVKAKAFELGLAGVGGKLSETAKIQARANIIFEKSGPAIGTAAREVDGASAKMDAFHGRVENLAIAIGEKLAPIVGDALGGLGTTIVTLGDAWESATQSTLSWAGTTVEASSASAGSVNIVEVAIGSLANGIQFLGTAFEALQGAAQQVFTWIAQGAAKLISVLDSLGESYLGFSTGLSDEFQTFADSMEESTKRMGEEFFRKWDETPWASDAISKRFQDSRDKLTLLRQDLAKEPLALPGNVGGKPGADNDKASKSPVNPFAGAALFGSSEAASITLRSRYGSRRDGAAESAKRTANNTAQLVAQNREVVRALNNLGAVGVQKI